MKTKRNKRVYAKRTTRAAKISPQTVSFAAHLQELRRRVVRVALSVALGAGLAYSVQQHIVTILLKPAGAQQFIYTSPGGGLNFLMSICIYAGVIMSTPVIVYNLLKFIEPVMPESSTGYILRGSAVAGLLAVAGVLFGYFFGLPSALKFLSHQFTTTQIHALISIQSYLSFVTMSLLASALIFQAPLIMLLINRIRPLKPGPLLKLSNQRWVILVSFILGAVISPTADIRPMILLAVPMVVSYEIGIGLVWHVNRQGRRPKSVLALLEQDAIQQAERLSKLQEAIAVQFKQPEFTLEPAYAEPSPVVSRGAGEKTQEFTRPTALSPLPAQFSKAQPSGGRANYRTIMTGQRVRRRVML